MVSMLEIASVPVIVTLVYWVINLIKFAVKGNATFLRLVPLIATGLGVAIAVTMYFISPQDLSAANIFNAIITGGSSGLAATGFHQFVKLGKKSDTHGVEAVPEVPDLSVPDVSEVQDVIQQEIDKKSDNDTK